MISDSRMPSARNSQADRAFNSRTVARKRRDWHQLRIALVIGVILLQPERGSVVWRLLADRFAMIATAKKSCFEEIELPKLLDKLCFLGSQNEVGTVPIGGSSNDGALG